VLTAVSILGNEYNFTHKNFRFIFKGDVDIQKVFNLNSYLIIFGGVWFFELFA
jgi:hypothetical protein